MFNCGVDFIEMYEHCTLLRHAVQSDPSIWQLGGAIKIKLLVQKKSMQPATTYYYLRLANYLWTPRIWGKEEDFVNGCFKRSTLLLTEGVVNKCFFGVLGGFLPQHSANCNKLEANRAVNGRDRAVVHFSTARCRRCGLQKYVGFFYMFCTFSV